MSPLPSLDGRQFRDVSAVHQGDVGAETVFRYREDLDGVVHGTYEGGAVRLGYLVGTRAGSDLSFRYCHVTSGGQTASGECRSRIEALPDGRLRLHETWEWTSHTGHGTSTLEELPPRC